MEFFGIIDKPTAFSYSPAHISVSYEVDAKTAKGASDVTVVCSGSVSPLRDASVPHPYRGFGKLCLMYIYSFCTYSSAGFYPQCSHCGALGSTRAGSSRKEGRLRTMRQLYI